MLDRYDPQAGDLVITTVSPVVLNAVIDHHSSKLIVRMLKRAALGAGCARTFMAAMVYVTTRKPHIFLLSAFPSCFFLSRDLSSFLPHNSNIPSILSSYPFSHTMKS